MISALPKRLHTIHPPEARLRSPYGLPFLSCSSFPRSVAHPRTLLFPLPRCQCASFAEAAAITPRKAFFISRSGARRRLRRRRECNFSTAASSLIFFKPRRRNVGRKRASKTFRALPPPRCHPPTSSFLHRSCLFFLRRRRAGASLLQTTGYCRLVIAPRGAFCLLLCVRVGDAYRVLLFSLIHIAWRYTLFFMVHSKSCLKKGIYLKKALFLFRTSISPFYL